MRTNLINFGLPLLIEAGLLWCYHRHPSSICRVAEAEGPGMERNGAGPVGQCGAVFFIAQDRHSCCGQLRPYLVKLPLHGTDFKLRTSLCFAHYLVLQLA